MGALGHAIVLLTHHSTRSINANGAALSRSLKLRYTAIIAFIFITVCKVLLLIALISSRILTLHRRSYRFVIIVESTGHGTRPLGHLFTGDGRHHILLYHGSFRKICHRGTLLDFGGALGVRPIVTSLLELSNSFLKSFLFFDKILYLLKRIFSSEIL